MAITQKDYRYRANQLLSLDFEDVTPRVIGFIEWLETDATAAAVLRELRDRDISGLLDDVGHQNPPKAKTPEDVASVAMSIIDRAAERGILIFQSGMAIGIRSSSIRIQDSSDEVLRRYLRPLWQYLELRLFEENGQPSKTQSSMNVNRKEVFVVHGRNETLRRSMFSFLRSVGLSPLEWERALSLTQKGSPYIGEVLDAAFAQAVATIVLLTPDDEARLKPEFLKTADGKEERELTGQARANVLFEAGMAFGRHQEKTILVQIGLLRTFSDIGGRHVVHLSNEMSARQAFVNRLRNVGCDIDQTGTDWHHEGDFAVMESPSTGQTSPEPLSGAVNGGIATVLCNEAHILIKEAALDQNGEIARIDFGDGVMIQTNDHNLMPIGDPRAQAKWEYAMQQLEANDLIRAQGTEREYFKLTELGYQISEGSDEAHEPE